MRAESQRSNRTDSDFLSQGTRCSGWLYLPEGTPPPPVVVMAHGFAAEKGFRLPAFAERFAAEGMAVFLFDYRHFGSSDGRPRNLVDPRRQLRDWEAAVAHVRALPGIDGRRLALWGVSFSGGHVLVAASRDPGISAIVCQVPFVDSLPVLRRMGARQVLRGAVAAGRDFLRMVTGRPPFCIPVVGDPGSLACLTAPGFAEGYLSIIPEGSAWKNQCPARIGLTLPGYRPTSSAARVRCPALIVMGEKDSLICPDSVEKAAAAMAGAELVRLPVGHFEPYAGGWFDHVVGLEARFLRKHLQAPAASGPPHPGRPRPQGAPPPQLTD